jgi:carboxylesterase type B
MKANGVANPGFYDQRAAFEWVREYIWAFGGNPTDVTGMGLSSGGSSLMFQIAAFGGNGTVPFTRAIPQSPAWSPHDNQVEAEEFVQNVTTAVGCSDFTCLQGVNFSTLNTAVTSVLQYGYILQPSVDGVFVPDLLDRLYTSGQFNPNVEVLVGHEQRNILQSIQI